MSNIVELMLNIVSVFLNENSFLSSYVEMLHEYLVAGRKLPSDKEQNPPIMKMTIFAPNVVVARSRFWYYLDKLHKVKKSAGQLLACKELPLGKTTVAKNFVVYVRYNSRSGTHNMRREYRDVTRVGAIEQMCMSFLHVFISDADMASRHRARFSSIHILGIEEVKSSDCRRANVREFHDSGIKFPLVRNIVRSSDRYFRKNFRTERPTRVF
ncbi:hypothetical protein P9112_005382 [Eukaryota sp. TZLM1-RC]